MIISVIMLVLFASITFYSIGIERGDKLTPKIKMEYTLTEEDNQTLQDIKTRLLNKDENTMEEGKIINIINKILK